MFYLRPRNAQADDQAMRNHSVQYVAKPDFDWYPLRRQWPWIYESWADLKPETWTHVRIELHGRTARLFLNGSDSPSLIVNGLKGEDLSGGVALWGYPDEESYFSNLRVTPQKPEPIHNGSDASGTWHVAFGSDYGRYQGTLELHRDGAALTGTWTGDFGSSLPVTGAWRDGYVELSFTANWQKEYGKPETVPSPRHSCRLDRRRLRRWPHESGSPRRRPLDRRTQTIAQDSPDNEIRATSAELSADGSG